MCVYSVDAAHACWYVLFVFLKSMNIIGTLVNKMKVERCNLMVFRMDAKLLGDIPVFKIRFYITNNKKNVKTHCSFVKSQARTVI